VSRLGTERVNREDGVHTRLETRVLDGRTTGRARGGRVQRRERVGRKGGKDDERRHSEGPLLCLNTTTKQRSLAGACEAGGNSGLAVDSPASHAATTVPAALGHVPVGARVIEEGNKKLS
jgi:hypothetical protein